MALIDEPPPVRDRTVSLLAETPVIGMSITVYQIELLLQPADCFHFFFPLTLFFHCWDNVSDYESKRN